MQLLERRFTNLMKSLKLGKGTPIAIACSGGPDSMALALLAKAWVGSGKNKLVAVTVDHGWKKDSAKEAMQVGQWLKKHGIRHVVLHGKGRKPSRNQHDVVRKIRYQILTHFCKQQGIAHLLVAHHLEDQAETFLLRLAQGGSVDRLAAMPASAQMFDITLVRPLLTLSKPDLLDYLKRRKQTFVDDPGNKDSTLDRVKLRKLRPALAEAGISVERLAKTAQLMARARAHLEEETGTFLKTYCKIAPEGYALFKHMPVSEEIALRVLSTLMMIVGGQDVKIRAAELERLHEGLLDSKFKGMTLGGCVFQRQKEGIVVFRELRALAAERNIKQGEAVLWDSRFEVTLKAAPAKLKVGPLGQAGWAKLSAMQSIKNTCPNKNILYSLPALRDARGVIMAVPHFGFIADKSITCTVAFRQTT